MLPLKYIRQNPELVRQGIMAKGADGRGLDEILVLDAEIREKITRTEKYKARRNQASQEIARLKREGEQAFWMPHL